MTKELKEGAAKVVHTVFAHGDPDAYHVFGQFMSARQYGVSPHIELASNAPGNDGLSAVVIWEPDYEKIAAFFQALAERAEKRLREERDNAEVESKKQVRESKRRGDNDSQGASS